MEAMIEAIRSFLLLLRAPIQDEHEGLKALAEALDRLACAYHQTPDVFDEAAPDPPPREFNVEMTRIGNAVALAFPGLGAYPLANLSEGMDQTVMVSSAIIDLAEIALDMEEILLIFERSSAEDAAWHFRFGYGTHWGRHLHDVRSYVHSKLF